MKAAKPDGAYELVPGRADGLSVGFGYASRGIRVSGEVSKLVLDGPHSEVQTYLDLTSRVGYIPGSFNVFPG